ARHDDAGARALAGDVADRDEEVARGREEEVVEVAAHLLGRDRAPGEVEARDHGRRLGEELPLDARRDLELLGEALAALHLLEVARVREGDAGEVAERRDELDRVRRALEGRLVEVDDAHDLAGRAEGDAEDGAELQARDRLEAGEVALRLRVAREERPAR